MSTREIVLFDIPHVNVAVGTSHIEAVIRHSPFLQGYAIHVGAYFHPIPEDTGLRSYPMSEGKYRPLVTGRFSLKTLTDLALDPKTSALARRLAGLE
jgi:hypothetical protein